MNFDILQAVLEIVFQRYMVYLTPVLFLFIVIMFGERLISFLYNVIRR
ncbi:hypothetical protein GGR02_001399 [Anoxybacillus voinovskiensis]|uniref:Uncharacterized protein n=1 Tax=Anoxybacteroides voinovskiense TaxID=230470 RepID=A0A840DTK8_9BACL|nr:hypothetical protein [Anoxybacillus voinovskiensis]GGJ63391.1 hypothetical protein GCM10008982_10750 [Anoxybacillus voinovskiensis]